MDYKMKYYVFVFVLLFAFSTFAQETSSPGSIKGKVIVSDGLYPLIGVNIAVKDKNRGTTSDTDGNFEITKLSAGSYTLVFSYVGFEQLTQTDIIVRPGRITFVEAKMIESSIKMNDVVVSAGYFNQVEAQPVSVVNYSAEEIRRSPGAAGDVSRILFGLPSLSKTNDQKNSLIVRGGSPMENAFFVDNIEIPNINHYGTQGSSEGPIGVINVDFLKDVNFHAGGFGVNYGDRLTSVMEMTFREGNWEQFDLQLDASMQALGGQFEGPINCGKGSYLVSLRRSYLDWIFKSTDIQSPLPTYYDFHAKTVYDLSDNLKLSVLDIASVDRSNERYDEAVKFEDSYFGYYNGTKNTFGVNLQNIWNKSGYSNISFSHNYFNLENAVNEVRTIDKIYFNNSIEQEFALRNLNHFRLNENTQLQFGFDLKYATNNYDHHYYPFVDAQGYTSPDLVVNHKFNGTKAGLFASVDWKPIEDLSINTGVRADYFDYNEKTNISPRMNIAYNLTEVTQLYVSGGMFYQTLPFILLSQSESFKELKNPKAYHSILGVSHLLTQDTRLTLEVYSKDYRDCPVNPNQPEEFTLDQAVENPVFLNNSKLVSSGKAYSRGIELMIQKKMAQDFYGMVSASYFRSRYLDGLSTWRNRVYDNRFTFSAEGGYKPNDEWDFSLRWIYAGGAPYSPFDVKASEVVYKGIVDKNRMYSERLPDYHSLNVRVDKRFNFYSSNIVLYISVWNVYGRDNIWGYSWDEINNKIKANKSWSTMPVFGVEYEL